MENRNIILRLVLGIVLMAVIATSAGIFTTSGKGSYEFTSIHGKQVPIYGKGLYQYMSADVAVQGIAQDYVTLFIAVPLLLFAFIKARKGSLRWLFILAGVLNYFLVTYLMYLEIAMYNAMFLAYVFLTGASFFAFALVLLQIDARGLPVKFKDTTPTGFTGGFLIFNSIIIALLWLSVVVPPLLDGSVIPDAVQHYTTLTVQGLDLAIFLPVSFVAGSLLVKKRPFGYLMATVTLVFLPLLMTALLAKIIAMALSGVNVIPAVFIIPVILGVSFACCILLIRSIKEGAKNM